MHSRVAPVTVCVTFTLIVPRFRTRFSPYGKKEMAIVTPSRLGITIAENADIFSGTGHADGDDEGDGDGRVCSVALFFGGHFF
jgi:hypothetical protein